MEPSTSRFTDHSRSSLMRKLKEFLSAMTTRFISFRISPPVHQPLTMISKSMIVIPRDSLRSEASQELMVMPLIVVQSLLSTITMKFIPAQGEVTNTLLRELVPSLLKILQLLTKVPSSILTNGVSSK